MLFGKRTLPLFPERRNPMNLFCVVGEIEQKPELKETANGLKVAEVTLKVQRPFVNSEGYYDYDYIPIEMWRGAAETLCAVAEHGTWISAKGRISTRNHEKDGRTYINPVFIAENVKYLK
ncbi:MAG TPA: single-stranded DNA-binding protein [Erysipelotrichaceae bacterium]|nr:single-stranded DNA-binding protein [Erysipelotrichaceae bacterium]